MEKQEREESGFESRLLSTLIYSVYSGAYLCSLLRLVLEAVVAVVVPIAASEPVEATLVVAVLERAVASVTVETGSTPLVQEARCIVVQHAGGRVGGSETSIGGIVAHWGTPL